MCIIESLFKLPNGRLYKQVDEVTIYIKLNDSSKNISVLKFTHEKS